jgi:hypothetical protein
MLTTVPISKALLQTSDYRMRTEKTHRDKYASMPPLRHNKNASSSEVLAHICATEGPDCTLKKAQSIFNVIRNPTNEIIVFDHAKRIWAGIDTVDVRVEMRGVKRKLVELETRSQEFAEHVKLVHNALLARLQGLEKSVNAITARVAPVEKPATAEAA